MCLKTAHSTGDKESARREDAALAEGTHTSQTWAAAGGMKGVGREAKKASSVAATSCALLLAGTCNSTPFQLMMSSSHNTRVDAPSWSRALTSAGLVIYAGNHWGMPYLIGLSGSNQNVISLKGHSWKGPATADIFE